MLIHKGIIAAANAAANLIGQQSFLGSVKVSPTADGCVAVATNGVLIASVTTLWDQLPSEAKANFDECCKEPARFPKCEAVLEEFDYDSSDCVQISVNAKYLADAMQAIADLAIPTEFDEVEDEFVESEPPVVVLRIPKQKGKPIRYDAHLQKHSVSGVIMPFANPTDSKV
ncbi:MAG: hypothetical protein ACPGXK_00120 [Phycisphaerae bacterium]